MTATPYTVEQEICDNQAARIGRIFNLPHAGMKMSRDGWTMTHTVGDEAVTLTVELVAHISREEAERILNGDPVEKEEP